MDCYDCSDGFYLFGNYTCRDCMSHCKTCTNDYDCLECKEGYEYDVETNTCVGCID